MSAQTLRETPYKGLVPYTEEDASYFFGREREREIIIANLMASRLTLLYGTSGVGKSSVLRAGVAHNLQQQAQKNLRERKAPEFGVLVFNSWRDNPIQLLELRLEEAMSSLVPPGNQKANSSGDSQRTLSEFLASWTKTIGGDLFIILDQFEEYFLYHAHEDGDDSFAVQFPRAVNRPDLRVNFLISMREDALAKLDRFKGRIPNLFDNYLRIDHLDRKSAQAAIIEPARTYNSLNPASPVNIEPALVEAVLDQVKTNEVLLGRGGSGAVETRPDQSTADARIETSYLQLVMIRLWQDEAKNGSRTLRLTTLNRLGSAKAIVQTHVDDVMQELELHEQLVAANLFYFLVTPDGTKIAHTISALSQYTGQDERQLKDLLEKLCGAGARILQPVDPPPGKPDTPRYEIRHDKLAGAILDWRQRHGQKQEVNRVRVVAFIIIALLVVAGTVALWAFLSQEPRGTDSGGFHSDVLIRGDTTWAVAFFVLVMLAVFTQYSKATVSKSLPAFLRALIRAAPALFLAVLSLYFHQSFVASMFLLCGIGDILLELPEKHFPYGFQLGTISFAGALCVFSVACYQTPQFGRPLFPLSITNIVICIFILRWVLPSLRGTERILQVSYFGLLIVANLFAATSSVPIFLGSSLWLMSDLSTAIGAKVTDDPVNSLDTLGLFHLALYFLAVGFLNA